MPGSSPCSFPKAERLLRRSDFLKIQASSRSLKTSCFTLLHSANDLGHPRIGITVSTSVGPSVMRNRIKRWIREFYRNHKKAFPEGLDFVFIAKPKASELDHGALYDELERLMKRLGQRSGGKKGTEGE